jgi:hypothetical protein
MSLYCSDADQLAAWEALGVQLDAEGILPLDRVARDLASEYPQLGLDIARQALAATVIAHPGLFDVPIEFRTERARRRG